MVLNWFLSRFLLSSSNKLKLHFIPTSNLDQSTLKEIHKFASQNLTGKTGYNDFIKFFKQFESTLLACDDYPRGPIRGMGVGTVIPAVLENKKKYYIIRPGLGFVQKEYREQGILFRMGSFFVIKEKLRRPFSRLCLISPYLSYKPYQIFCNHSKGMYPRYDAPTPEEEQRIIDYYVSLVYNSNRDESIKYQRGIITLQHAIKEEIGAIASEKDLHDPHVKFYLKNNPNWTKGDALVAIQMITWRGAIAMMSRLLKS